MTKSQDRARRRWSTLLIVGIVLSALIVLGLRSNDSGATKAPRPGSQNAAPDRQKRIEQAFHDTPAVRRTEQEEFQVLIADYEQRVEEDPTAEDAPALLTAAANLCRQKLQDNSRAAALYERVLLEFPQWERIESVYPLLVSCYEATNDYKSLKWLCESAMEKFPEGSSTHEFAKQKLGLK